MLIGWLNELASRLTESECISISMYLTDSLAGSTPGAPERFKLAQGTVMIRSHCKTSERLSVCNCMHYVCEMLICISWAKSVLTC